MRKYLCLILASIMTLCLFRVCPKNRIIIQLVQCDSLFLSYWNLWQNISMELGNYLYILSVPSTLTHTLTHTHPDIVASNDKRISGNLSMLCMLTSLFIFPFPLAPPPFHLLIIFSYSHFFHFYLSVCLHSPSHYRYCSSEDFILKIAHTLRCTVQKTSLCFQSYSHLHIQLSQLLLTLLITQPQQIRHTHSHTRRHTDTDTEWKIHSRKWKIIRTSSRLWLRLMLPAIQLVAQIGVLVKVERCREIERDREREREREGRRDWGNLSSKLLCKWQQLEKGFWANEY